MATMQLDKLLDTIAKLNPFDLFMYVVGFAGQVFFGMRFLVQWIATERRKRVTIPMAFWYISIAGTVLLLSYAIYRVDPVFIAGLSLNMVVYARNIYFARRRRPIRFATVAGQPPAEPPPR